MKAGRDGRLDPSCSWTMPRGDAEERVDAATVMGLRPFFEWGWWQHPPLCCNSRQPEHGSGP